ncbi:aspartate, glycine, lysine and serine-rich protein-like, partial [Sitodiplosis mosellana]|uniref:aspartate, glycine, lysine and serine-rich protein-like n=1 Tax=Sitodiplosis mosellana TaxID=263140 RepID=UPI0024452920
MKLFAINTVSGSGKGINRSLQFDTITSIRMKYSKILLLALFAIIATIGADPEPEPEALAEAEPEPTFGGGMGMGNRGGSIFSGGMGNGGGFGSGGGSSARSNPPKGNRVILRLRSKRKCDAK